MKKFILSVAAAIVMMAMFTVPASADTEFVCQTNVNIWSGPPNATDTKLATVVTGTLFRGTDTDQCAKAQARYSRIYAEATAELYKTPEEGVKVGKMIMGK